MKRRFSSTLIAVALLLAQALAPSKAYAATGNYDFYPTTTTNILDSHPASKAGGNLYENCAYITPSYFSKTGSVRFWVEGNGVTTERKIISSGGVNVKRYLYYTTSAPAGGSYYVGGRVVAISSGTSMRVRGAFTP